MSRYRMLADDFRSGRALELAELRELLAMADEHGNYLLASRVRLEVRAMEKGLR